MFSAGKTAVKNNDANYVEDVFSTHLYTGNGSTQTITNNIDLATKGGLVWTKTRNVANSNWFIDTVRGGTQLIRSNTTEAQFTSAGTSITFGPSSYVVDSDNLNTSTQTQVSWTFRKQPKFFDVVTYTGNGSVSSIAHNLGSTPGCIIIKATNGTTPWAVYHRSTTTPNNYYLLLNTADAAANAGTVWCTPTSTEFTVQNTSYANASGVSYVAYIFAHNAGGFGLTGTDNVISCGSYTGNGATNNLITIGYEPQWVLLKRTSVAGDWGIIDTMRGWSYSTENVLKPNTSGVEDTGNSEGAPTATGFDIGNGNYNISGQSYIYIAIRRGPMKVPTLGTSVFGLTLKNSYGANEIVSTSFAPDMNINKATTLILDNFSASRLTGGWLATNTNVAETSGTWKWDGVAGQGYATVGYSNAPIYWSFRRAPGFFDVVAGKYFNGNLAHNLGVVPELVIAKQRDSANGWYVWTTGFTTSQYLGLSNSSAIGSSLVWDTMTSTQIGLQNLLPSNTGVYYLFATCPGVSKVGSYTGTGALQTIACGFTSGARFVLIKRTDSTGDWYVWDSARGITSGTDPYLLLNSTATEVTNTNYVDTDTTGFKVTSAAPAALNAVGGNYIFLAIA